jgi:hypothetical protein
MTRSQLYRVSGLGIVIGAVAFVGYLGSRLWTEHVRESGLAEHLLR